jgi:hypothetical protein
MEAGVVHGVVPTQGFSTGLGASIGGRWLAVSGAVHYSPPREAESERVSVQAASARLLLLLTPPTVGWFGAGVEGNLLFGRGEHLERATRDMITRGAGCVEAGVTLFERGRHQLAMAADVSLAFQRARFRTRGQQSALPPRYTTVYRPKLWGLTGALRWQIHFDR